MIQKHDKVCRCMLDFDLLMLIRLFLGGRLVQKIPLTARLR